MEKHLTQPNQSSLPSIREGLTKKEIELLARQSVTTLLEEGNVFQVAEALAAMEEFAKAVRKNEDYIEFLREELSKNNGRLSTPSGARIEICEAGISYDYSQNAEWNEINEQVNYWQARKKQLEEKLRRIAPGKITVDPETGEVMEGVNKTSRSTYRITLAR
jgi:predicted heme/steroid binding protein